MDLKQITFCDKTINSIISNDYKKKIIEMISDIGFNISKNPYTTLQPKDITQLKNPYLISYITAGNSYFLYLVNINGINLSFFIDTKITDGYIYPKIIVSRYRFDDHLYKKPTLFRGDIIKNGNNWKYIIYDIIISENKILKLPVIKKLQLIRKILYNNYVFDPYFETCPIKVKNYYVFDKKHIGSLFEYIENLDYKIIGVIFIPFYNPNLKSYTILHNKNNYKFKKNPIVKKKYYACFLMTKTFTPGIYQLYCLKNKELFRYGMARISGLECNNFIQSNIKEKRDKILVNCKYDDNFDKFVPLELSKNKEPDNYNIIMRLRSKKNIKNTSF